MAVEDSGELEPSTIVDETVVSVAVAETKMATEAPEVEVKKEAGSRYECSRQKIGRAFKIEYIF